MLADAKLEKKKLHKGSFCGNRFCPMCAWRQARKDALKIGTIMKWLDRLRKAVYFCDTNHAQRIGGGTAGGD